MNAGKLTWMMAGIGGFLGGYIPLLWGASYFSFSSLLFNTIGAIFGVWVAFRMTH